jgi:hypothetical protein
MFVGQSGMQGASQLWKIKAPSKHKFLFWLVLQDRCWTNDRQHWHGISKDATCSLCLQQVESIDHLIIACTYSHEV